MSVITRRVFRPYAFFVLPESEREEPFLGEMSWNGWHLVKTNYFSYKFQKGEPADYQYRMDFMSKELGRAEYVQLLQDAGWEIVDTRRDDFGVWAYCRKLRSENDTLELYTDTESKLELVRRIKKAYWRLLGISLVILALFGGVGMLLGGDREFLISSLTGGVIGGVIGGLIGYVAIWGKIRKIKKEMNTL